MRARKAAAAARSFRQSDAFTRDDVMGKRHLHTHIYMYTGPLDILRCLGIYEALGYQE